VRRSTLSVWLLAVGVAPQASGEASAADDVFLRGVQACVAHAGGPAFSPPQGFRPSPDGSSARAWRGRDAIGEVEISFGHSCIVKRIDRPKAPEAGTAAWLIGPAGFSAVEPAPTGELRIRRYVRERVGTRQDVLLTDSHPQEFELIHNLLFATISLPQPSGE
jgi:hypothetical protein